MSKSRNFGNSQNSSQAYSSLNPKRSLYSRMGKLKESADIYLPLRGTIGGQADEENKGISEVDKS